MTRIEISIDDDLRTFLEGQARQRGYDSVDEYLPALLREVQRREAGNGRSPSGHTAAAQSAWDVALAIGASIPKHEWDKVPTDLARNLDHYLYGHPRED